MNEIIIVGSLLVLAVISIAVGLLLKPDNRVTHENRAAIARAYFDHVTEVQDGD